MKAAPLFDLISDARSGFASGKSDPAGIFQVRMNNITRGGQWDLASKRYVPLDGKSLDRFSLAHGDVLFNATNSPDLIGKTAFVDRLDEPTVFSNHFLRLRTLSSRLDPHYLARWLQLQFDRGTFSAICQRWVNQASVPRDRLLGLSIPLPPLDAQLRIVRILDKADALRTKRRDSLALLERLRASTFFDRFVSDHERGWQLLTVGDLAVQERGAIRTGPFGSQLLHSEFVDEGVAVLGIDNVVANRFRWTEQRFVTEPKYAALKRYTVCPGDVLVTIMGTCGRAAIVPDDIPRAINTKHLCCITLNRDLCLPEYLQSYFLLHPAAQAYLRGRAKGAIMSGLNMSIIKDMPIRVPPLEQQREYALALDSSDDTRHRQETHLAHLDALFASLQHRAFAGEL